jgi:hypothetical protein
VIEGMLAGDVVRVASGMDDAAPADRGVAAGNSRIGIPNTISVPTGVRILLATRPVDFRKYAG